MWSFKRQVVSWQWSLKTGFTVVLVMLMAKQSDENCDTLVHTGSSQFVPVMVSVFNHTPTYSIIKAYIP